MHGTIKLERRLADTSFQQSVAKLTNTFTPGTGLDLLLHGQRRLHGMLQENSGVGMTASGSEDSFFRWGHEHIDT